MPAANGNAKIINIICEFLFLMTNFIFFIILIEILTKLKYSFAKFYKILYV